MFIYKNKKYYHECQDCGKIYLCSNYNDDKKAMECMAPYWCGVCEVTGGFFEKYSEKNI
jgi:hypothetical protein